MTKTLEPWAPGRRFGNLTVIIPWGRKRKADGSYVKSPVTLCICKCGQLTAPHRGQLLQGRPTSCTTCAKKTHGLSKTYLGTTFRGIKRRCDDPRATGYQNYGARGIKCLLNSPQEILDDIGHRPSKTHTIDRIKNNGHYEKGNIRWATKLEQGANKRTNKYIELAGRKMIINDWARELKILGSTLRHRVNKGYCPKDILLMPLKNRPLTPGQLKLKAEYEASLLIVEPD